MSDYTWPDDLAPYGMSFYLQPHSGGSQSPFSRVSKIYGLSKPLWICRIVLRAPDSADRWAGECSDWGERVDAFLAKLDGRTNRVGLWDFRRPGRSPSFTNGAATAATNTITLTGASVGDIRVGEYIGGDDRPHIITDLAVSGSDLVATVKPYWESDIAIGDAVFQNVSGFFRLATDDAVQNGSQVDQLTEYQLDFIEDPGPTVDVTFDSDVVTYSG